MSGREALTWALAHSIWQLAAAAAALVLLRALIPADRATARYLAACAALAAQLLAPAITFVSAYGNASATAAAAGATAVELGARIADWVPMIWALGVQLMLLRVAFGWWRIRRVERTATALEPALRARFEGIARELGVRRPLRWLATDGVPVPMTTGALRPIIFLPLWAISGVPAASLEMIVAHELAHVRRWDYAVNLVQSLVEAIYFFHPVVWWVSAKAREDREACCDDLVVERFADPLDYARALACLEESRASFGGLQLASSGGSLMQRIQRLFERSERHPRRGRWSSPLLIAGLAIFVLWTGSAIAEQLANKTVSLSWLPPAVQKYRVEIEAAAAKHGVDANLLAVLVLVESGGDTTARSPSGARGLMQVMPKTAEQIARARGIAYAEAQLDEPAYNLDLGAWYLAEQIASFGGVTAAPAIEHGVAAYNGGPDQVRAWLKGQRALSEETSKYKTLVTALFGDASSSAYVSWRSKAREKSAAIAESPVADAKRSLQYGEETHPFTKQPYFHAGVDLVAAAGAPVKAPLDGVVAEVSTDPKKGNVLVLRHSRGIETVYHHLGSVAVARDQKLAKGALLGTVGATGETTGPHVHFEVRDLGEAIDPAPFLH